MIFLADFSQPYPLKLVNTVLRNYHLAGFVNGSKIFKSLISNFKDNRPSSFLAATFGRCLFTPNDFLQRKIWAFSIITFIDSPYLGTIEENG